MNGEWVRVSKGKRCPCCDKPNWCSVSSDGTKAVCMRTESDKPTKNHGWLHILKEADELPKPSSRPIVRSYPLASRSHLDGIYTTLIRKHLVLASEHRSNLRERGLSETDIDNNGYRSVPTPLYGETVARLLSEYDLRGVPGFYRDRNRWQMFTPGAGFLISIRDSRHRIRGFQIRADFGSTRYLWFSSASKPEGQSSGAPIHFARPNLIAEQRRVFITEGALKADVIAASLNAPVIGIPGVSTWPGGFGQKLRKVCPEIKEVFLCFDSDFRTNEHVAKALFNLIAELRLALYSPVVLSWDEAFKGLDDYLNAA
jgi:DNA primase